METTGMFILSSLMGVIVGGLFSSLFFSLNKSWSKILTAAIFTGSTIPGGGFILEMFQLEQTVTIYSLAFYLFFQILTFFFSLSYMFKKLDVEYEKTGYLSRFDIFFGYDNIKTDYYRTKNQLFNKKTKDLENAKNDLISEKKIYQNLNNNLISVKKDLQDKERAILDQVEKGINVVLPIDSRIPVDQTFVSDFPQFHDKVIAFTKDLNFFTKSLVDDLPKSDLKQQHEKVLGFFQALCNKISHIIFADIKARVHTRYFNNNQYIKLITSYDKQANTYKLTPIDNSAPNMIKAAGAASRSLIKSLNLDYHQTTKREQRWSDYLTLIFDEFVEDETGEPLFSMGISIREGEHSERTLKYLNFIEIERVIQDNLKEINNIVNIAQFLKSIENGSEAAKN